jgi:uncharacterized protein YraI
MIPFWKTSFGKLVIGGCGTQVGLLVSLVSLAGLLVFCFVCASTNFVSLGLMRQAAAQPGVVPVPQAAPANSPINVLLREVDALLGEVDRLEVQSSQPGAAGPASAPVSLDPPAAVADRGQAGLRDGPGDSFNEVGALAPGDSVPIIGRTGDAAWWLVSLPDGHFAWVAASAVTALNLTDTIPVVTAPSLLAGAGLAAVPGITPTVTASPTPPLPPGTPTPASQVERQFVEEFDAYKRVKAALLVPPISASFSPDGTRIAITERIKLYTFTTAGAHTDIWFVDDDNQGPTGWVVWSPDGEHLAFVVGFKGKYCQPCESVAILRLADGVITFLEAPDDQDTDAPRWTQDGRILVNVHPREPADGETYVYDVFGRGQPAEGVYVLSTSHDGQQWYPWLPGRIWRAGVTERPDSYVRE